jgi:hypothetical protein
MTNLSPEKSPSTTPATRGTRPSGRKVPKRRAPSAVVAKPRAPGAPVASPRTTKQERVLTLLSRPDGAGLDELMLATGWQKHSVRGFLAGTVKKKLGLKLTSSKADGEARRYRVEARSAR